MKNTLVYVALVVLLAGCASTQEGAPASGSTPTPSTPIAEAAPAEEASSELTYFTVEQARRGSGFFRNICVNCHDTSEFEGSSFQRRWTNRAVGDVYDYVIYSMPEDDPGSLPAQTYADILAYVLQLNDFPAGETELPTSITALMEMKMW